MVNEIKLDALANASTLAKPVSRESKTTTAHAPHEDVTISTSLGSLVSSMIAENSTPDNSQRIIELKQQIQTNQYKVDIDQLAKKLSHTILSIT